MRKLNVTADQMVDLLNDESGLKGISGLSDDMRTLTDAADTNPQAQLAIDMYVNRVVQYVGAYVAEMNGVDAFAFAGGIGEHSSAIRAQIMSHFQYLGATIDAKQNARNSAEVDLSDPDASVRTWLVPTDEELMIVRDTYRLVTTQQPAQ
jgi:acetate kinase